MLGLSAEEYRRLILSVGTHRDARPLTPVQAAGLFEQARRAGSTPHLSAEATHLSPSTVNRFLKLLTLAPEIQHLVDWGQSGSTISFSSAFELARLPSSEHELVATAVLERGLTSSEVRQLTQLRQRSGRSISECIEGTLAMRPQVVRKHVFIGAVTGADLAARLAAMTQSERDGLLSSVVDDLGIPSYVDIRLGEKRFTLVGDDAVGKAVNGLGDFEQVINEQLQRRAS